MNVIAIPSVGHDRVGYIRRLMNEGYKLIQGGHQDWVEGSLKVAEALKAAKENWPANIGFGAWLKTNNFEAINHTDRAALINLAGDMDLARTILAESESTSYKVIWNLNKTRFSRPAKTPRRTPRKPRSKPGRLMIFREMKLGSATIQKIKGTSLDSAQEIDELIMLNRGAAPGELTPAVAQLVEDAASGKHVSAIASSGAHKMPALMEAWRKRMVAPWLRADKKQREALLDYLMSHLEDAQ